MFVVVVPAAASVAFAVAVAVVAVVVLQLVLLLVPLLFIISVVVYRNKIQCSQLYHVKKASPDSSRTREQTRGENIYKRLKSTVREAKYRQLCACEMSVSTGEMQKAMQANRKSTFQFE